MNCYQTLAANTALMSIGTFGSKLLVFLMVRFYTGYLTPAEYGTADLITQTANLLIPLVSLDITDGVFRFAADRNSGRADVFSVGFRIITLGSLLMLRLWRLQRISRSFTATDFCLRHLLLHPAIMRFAPILCVQREIPRCLPCRAFSTRRCLSD